MTTLVVYAHPYEGSFNHHIFESVKKISNDIEIIDLYREEFNLVYSKEELSLFKFGKSTNSIVKDYQNKISNCSQIVFIFPVWWNDVPGIVKNFIDLVMKKNFAYEDTSKGVKGKLTHIESVKVITTSNSPTWYIKFFGGNAIQKTFLDATFKQLGVRKRKWVNLGNIKNISNQKRRDFIENLG